MSAGAWLDDVPAEAFAAAVTLIERARADDGRVVLAAHIAPDGDALGATLGLYHGLRAHDLAAVPVVGEAPLRVPQTLAQLPGVDELRDADAMPPAGEVALLVTLDVASPDRLGRTADLVGRVPTLVVDHHAQHTVFGDVRLVAPRAAATVMVVEELLRRLEVPITPVIASCLYVGLVTDTGRFGHASTDRAAMELGGRLLEIGIDQATLHEQLFGNRSLGEVRLLGRALERVHLEPELSLVHTHLTEADLDGAGAGPEATDGIIDIVQTIDVAEVALFVKPGGAGRWRVSLRSAGGVDVGALAARFGGGGHARAAGFTADGEVADVVRAVTSALREA